MRCLRKKDLVLPMLPDKELEAGEEASVLATQASMDPDRIDELRLAVQEAFINASEHSGASDGRVYIDIALLGGERPELVQVTVRDTGVGFSEGALRGTMRGDEGRPRKRGWGLTLIRRLVDEVEIESGTHGTVVVMRKKI
ncbi:MAG TPA: ATP-binding protein [Thermoanaerobaculia bacterium]|jgi:anti-sigma regulatory factor (Ser/Thr protein kinase)|nr:ATP-binding protein [Thermoanaerobaculia bacterium]